MMPPRWEHFPHDADIGVRGFGATMEEAFAQAALALTAVIADPESVREVDEVAIACSAPDAELLLADWLNALIYEMSTRKMLFRGFAVRIDDGRLCGKARGEAVDVEKHRPAVEVKGATYTQLEVRLTGGVWCAQCVVDV